MFDEKRKIEYMKQIQDSKLIDALTNYFEKSEPEEEALEKDLSDWTREEILKFYSEMNISSIIVKEMNKQYRAYAYYYNPENRNWEISDRMAMDAVLIAKDDESYKIFSEYELYNIIEKLNNYCDKFLISAMFDGIKGQNYEEIFMAKITDFTETEATLYEDYENPKIKRVIPIRRKTYEYALKSSEEYAYYAKNGRITRYLVGDTIIKRQNGQSNILPKLQWKQIQKKLLRFSHKYPKLNPQNIYLSGILSYILQQCNYYGINPKEFSEKSLGWNDVANKYDITKIPIHVKRHLQK